jgi:hypothetical protein
MYGDAFCGAVVVLTQIAINNGEKLFATGYRDPPYETTNKAYDAASDDEDNDDATWVDDNDL